MRSELNNKMKKVVKVTTSDILCPVALLALAGLGAWRGTWVLATLWLVISICFIVANVKKYQAYRLMNQD